MNELIQQIDWYDGNTIFTVTSIILGIIWIVGVLIHAFINRDTISAGDVVLKLTGGTIAIMMFGTALFYILLIGIISIAPIYLIIIGIKSIPKNRKQ